MTVPLVKRIFVAIPTRMHHKVPEILKFVKSFTSKEIIYDPVTALTIGPRDIFSEEMFGQNGPQKIYREIQNNCDEFWLAGVAKGTLDGLIHARDNLKHQTIRLIHDFFDEERDKLYSELKDKYNQPLDDILKDGFLLRPIKNRDPLLLVRTVYCATPSRMENKTEEIINFVRRFSSQDMILLPQHPFRLGHRKYMEDGVLGRKSTLEVCLNYLEIADWFTVFGISDGTLKECRHSLDKTLQRIHLLHEYFDSDCKKHYSKLGEKYNKPLDDFLSEGYLLR